MEKIDVDGRIVANLLVCFFFISFLVFFSFHSVDIERLAKFWPFYFFFPRCRKIRRTKTQILKHIFLGEKNLLAITRQLTGFHTHNKSSNGAHIPMHYASLYGCSQYNTNAILSRSDLHFRLNFLFFFGFFFVSMGVSHK